MGRIAFTTEAKKATTNYDYPKLKLKQGESARFLCLESPVMEYVHTLRAPQIANGVPVMETKQRKDGTEYRTNRLDFISKPICLGDETVLDEKGSDPKNCPMCLLAKTNPDYTQAPARRFAMHVIRYRTKPGGSVLVTPYSVETVVWGFTDMMFNKIVDLKEEFGDLRKHDLILGPCTNELFQKADLSPSAKAEWLSDKERQALTAQTFKENQIPDLAIACGSRKELKWVEEDVAVIKQRWADVNGLASEDDEALSEGLDGLMDGGIEKDAEDWAKEVVKATTANELPAEDLDLSGLLDVDPDEPGDDIDIDAALADAEPEPVKKAPAKKAPAKKAPAAEVAAPEAASEEADDFDDLLNDI